MEKNYRKQLEEAISLLNDAYSKLDVIAKDVDAQHCFENLKISKDGRPCYCPSLENLLVPLCDIIDDCNTISNY
jgi:hypothetical protein